jgi:nucleotide-binding universal stress UspA family protein
MFENIIVPLDGSEKSKRILPYVRYLALKFRSNVHVLGIGVGSERRRVNRLLEQYINNISSHLSTENVEANPAVIYGRPADKLLTHIQENNFDLIIMATHGRGGITRWWVGSVAERIISEALPPVLLIRSNHDEANGMEEVTFSNILTPLDGSDIGETALPHAEALASATGATIDLLHIIPPPGGVEAKLFGSELKKPVKAAHDSGENYLGDVAERLVKKGINTKYKVTTGDPASIIIEHAIEHKSRLIAMSTHGRSGIARWILGSVADKVLQKTAVPMWLVKSPKMIAARPRDEFA